MDLIIFFELIISFFFFPSENNSFYLSMGKTN